MGGRRAPIIAGVATSVVVLLVALVLVLPKMGQVKDAKSALQEAQDQQGTLGAQLAALKQSQTNAPKNREIIRKVQQAIPPTVDQQGFMLLIQNVAVESSIDLVTITPTAPVFDPATGLSTVTNAFSVTGSYFAVTEFIFKIETLPRASKITSITIAPAPTDTDPSLLSLSASVDTYTSDQSAGPGSAPGPTGNAPTTSTTSGA